MNNKTSGHRVPSLLPPSFDSKRLNKKFRCFRRNFFNFKEVYISLLTVKLKNDTIYLVI